MMAIPTNTFSLQMGKRPLYYLYHLKKLIRIEIRIEKRDDLTKARGNTLRNDGTRARKREVQILPHIKSSSIYKGLKNLWSNSLQGGEDDEGLTPTKDGGTCLRRLSIFRKEVH